MKILLFGTRGQVGWELQRSLAPLGELITLDFGEYRPLRRSRRPARPSSKCPHREP